MVKVYIVEVELVIILTIITVFVLFYNPSRPNQPTDNFTGMGLDIPMETWMPESFYIDGDNMTIYISGDNNTIIYTK
jgi:hypothetical protein